MEKFKKRASPDDIAEIDGRLGAMNRGPIKEIWDKVQSLWGFIKDPDAPWGRRAWAIAGLVYLVSPLDAVPDVVPGLGLIDDVAVILFIVRELADEIQQYVVKTTEATAKAAAEAKAQVEIKKHTIIVLTSICGAIVIAALILAFRHGPQGLVNLADAHLLEIYQAILLCVSVGAIVSGFFLAREWLARYRQLPTVPQQAIREGIYSATGCFVREEWPKLLLLVSLLLVLAGLAAAIRWT